MLGPSFFSLGRDRGSFCDRLQSTEPHHQSGSQNASSCWCVVSSQKKTVTIQITSA